MAKRMKQTSTAWRKNLTIALPLVCLLLFSALNFATDYRNAYKYELLKNVYSHPTYSSKESSDSPTFEPDARHLVKAAHGAVACDVPLCSKMGVDILAKNGSAADAAITIALCIGVINSHSSGIGGGAFIVSKPFGRNGVAIDAREMAPAAAEMNMYNHRETLSKWGGLASAIPGELKGLEALYKMHGSGNLKWEELLEPVIDLARSGWKVSETTANAFELVNSYLDLFDKEDWSFAFNHDGSLKKEGDFMNRPQLANTLAMVAKNGSSDIFYDSEGPIVRSLVKKVAEKGGILTKEDFAKYKVRVTDALTTNFLNDQYAIYTAEGSSSGPALISGLHLIEHFFNSDGFKEDFGTLETHRLTEVFKWIASVRSNFGDLSIYSTNKTEIKEHEERYHKFLSLDWANKTYGKINDTYTLPDWKDYEPAYHQNDPHGTAHFSVVDQHDNAVAITTTVNLLFGSLVHDPVTGVIMNDEMDDFSVPTASNAFDLMPSIYNWIVPYKRPLSAMCPSVIIDSKTQKPDFIIGAAGGSRIITAVLQAIVRKYYFGLEILDIIARPRLHHQLLPELLYIEEPELPELTEALEAKGHTVQMIAHLTAMNGIQFNKKDKLWEAVSDYWRKRGEAYGY